MTAKETQDKCIRLMGTDLGTLYYDLFSQVAWLHAKWEQYRELFDRGSERIDLLNKTAPLFFGLLQDTLFDDVLLHLARLTDPPQSGPKSRPQDNLTLLRLTDLVNDRTLKTHVKTALKGVQKSCKFAREWRNKRLAHTDLLIYRNRQAKPLATASCKNVEAALTAMRELLNSIEGHYSDSEVAYDLESEPGGADFLVYYLEEGLRVIDEKQYRRRKNSGSSASK